MQWNSVYITHKWNHVTPSSNPGELFFGNECLRHEFPKNVRRGSNEVLHDSTCVLFIVLNTLFLSLFYPIQFWGYIMRMHKLNTWVNRMKIENRFLGNTFNWIYKFRRLQRITFLSYRQFSWIFINLKSWILWQSFVKSNTT